KSVDHIEEAAQKTEDIIGPYALHDFFLYFFVRYGVTWAKIFRIAAIAFDGAYSGGEIKKWLVVFLRRFFSMQFKRGCAPDGPRVGSVSLSPRGGWLMPSDISGAAWIERAERIII
ncbi:MAG: NAD(+) synthase, partial [Oscillospiraceae bacterium]|nr:NAD(+) synthase [Oscillospiraceae bacterium]